MTDRHALFDAYPITGDVTLPSGAKIPDRYQVTKGRAVILTGHGDPDAVAKACNAEDVYPVHDAQGRVAMGMFVCRFDEASHGPHLELHIGALAAPNPGETISSQPEAFLAAFATKPGWGFLSLGLWNDTETVVACNSTYFGLDAKPAKGFVDLAPGKLSFSFQSEGQTLASGSIAHRRFPEPGALWHVVRLMGLRAFIASARAPWAASCVINRKGVFPQNRRARTFIAADEMSIMRFRDGRDRLDLGQLDLARFGFVPTAMQHMAPFRFVYLHPDDTAG